MSHSDIPVTRVCRYTLAWLLSAEPARNEVGTRTTGPAVSRYLVQWTRLSSMAGAD